MPEFDANELLSGNTTFAWAYVMSVTLFPDDHRAQRAAQHSIVAEEVAEALRELSADGVDVPVDARLAIWLYEAPPLRSLLGRPVLSAMRPGILAGAMLSFILRAADNGYPELASVGVVRRAASHQLRFHRGSSIETMKQGWARYASVAALWAFATDYFRLEPDHELLLLFLAHAEELRRMGEAYVPRHGRVPVLDRQTTWKVPAAIVLPPVTITLSPPSDEDLRMVASGKFQLR